MFLLKWFKLTTTNLGNCFTFNHDELDVEAVERSPTGSLVQTSQGPLQGLSLKLDIQLVSEILS